MARYHKRYSPLSGVFLLFLSAYFYFSYTSTSKSAVYISPLFANSDQYLRPFFLVTLILGGIWVVGYVLYGIYHENQLSKTGIFDIDKMSGSEFEERLMILFKNLGYKVQHVGRTADAGVDLIIERNGMRTAVQAKRYQGNVGEHAVQEVHTGKDYYRCDEAIIVTNSNFTEMAWKVAQATNIKLWSRNYLIKVLLTEKKNIHLAERSKEDTQQ